MTAVPRATGLLVGYAADVAFGDPVRCHPVAGFGQMAQRLESTTYADSRRRGIGFALAGVVPVVVAAAVAERAVGRAAGRAVGRAAGRALGRVAERAAGRAGGAWLAGLVAAGTWAVLGGTGLRRAALGIAGALAAGDLAAAQARLPSLCGRDPAGLDAGGLSRAVVESLAENTSDAVVAPLFWGAVVGVPGLWGYRAVNTLDAMVGHRSTRYWRFGWAAARLDDVANLVPARLTAALTVAVAPLVGADAAGAWRVWRRDGGRHPSPNGGQCEAAFAGALGLRLGGRNRYSCRVEERPQLGDGRPAEPADIARAVRLASAVSLAAAVTAAVAATRFGRWPA